MTNETKENESQKLSQVLHVRGASNSQKEQPRRTKARRLPTLSFHERQARTETEAEVEQNKARHLRALL